MKLALGTVQFGFDYGISNDLGQTSEKSITEILQTAKKHNIDILDTSCGYGQSESLIGQYAKPDNFDIVTKTPAFSNDIISIKDANKVRESFFNSLQALKTENVYGLLTHGPEDLLKPGGQYIYDVMKDLKKDGKINKIGASVYNKNQIKSLVSLYDIDLIQLPFSILDQRLLHDGTFDFLKQNNIEIHVRSAFLQGLMFIPLDKLPKFFHPIKPALTQLKQTLSDLNLTPAQAALAFVNQTPQVDKIICGVNNQAQLLELTDAINSKIELKDFYQFAIEEQKFIDPSQWP